MPASYPSPSFHLRSFEIRNGHQIHVRSSARSALGSARQVEPRSGAQDGDRDRLPCACFAEGAAHEEITVRLAQGDALNRENDVASEDQLVVSYRRAEGARPQAE